jgi:type IV pilus assembly protein PilY1
MNSFSRSMMLKSTTALLVAGAVFGSANGATLALQDVPLYLLSRADPNVLVNMSVETPMGGAAYTDHVGVPAACTGRPTVGGNSVGTCYFPAYDYIGYFNPKKCYTYAATQFNPTGTAATLPNHTCTGAWSGNFLNWVSMTAIDMFIMTMTGGNRIVDAIGSSAETVVRRARKTDNDSWFPVKYVNSTNNVAPNTVTPYSDSTLYFYNTAFGFNVATSFDDARNGSGGGFKASFTTAVRVCSPTPAGLDDNNCVSYGSSPTYLKPEGAIQRNARTKRFGAISYSTDGSNNRHGGVLRSNMKYVGPKLPNGIDNPVAEFTVDGQLVNNPDGASGGFNSGVINYINKFSDAAYKSLDPVSELFYESIRYFKHLGPTPEYSAGLTDTQKGGFQVVNSWSDPQQYKCQKNFIIAINDANPWLDKRLPGTAFMTPTITGASGTVTLDGEDYGEPSNADHDINVRDLTNRVGTMEGLNGNWPDTGTWVSTGANGSISGANDSVGGGAGSYDNSCTGKTVTALGEVMGTCPAPQKQNSYYVAGLAYYANTTDLRSDFPNDRGIQNVQTFMIDTQEFNNNPLDGPKNMLWLTGKYGGFTDANNNGTPETSEWDADGDGAPDNYVLATQPQNLVNGLDRAFDFIEGRVSSASSASVNSGSISNLTRIYQTRFNSGTWSGQLLAFRINADGTLGNGIPPLTDSEAEWDAAQELPAWNARQIITRDSTGAKVAFQWNSLDAPRQTQLISQAMLEYLRGNGTNEGNVAGKFRPRVVSKLGDMVSSAPLFVARPPFRYRDNLEGSGSVAYSTFVAANDTDAERLPMVYAGANDGMLHGFNGNTGAEVFAFIPTPMFKLIGAAGTPARLTKLAQQNYQHEYFVDGPPSLGDAYWGGAWHTVIAGGLNKGGQGIYALDVTSTSRLAAAETTANAQNTILWEVTDATEPDLGYTFSQPSIVKSHDTTSGGTGRWVVAFGNGYNSTASDGAASTTGNAVLFIRDAATGASVAKLDTGVGSGTPPTGVTWANGLSTPAFVDVDADRIIDYAYAGDLWGNMWKFDLRGTNPTTWKVAYGTAPKAPLFTAVDASGKRQPITVRPEVTRGPKGAGMVVLFGTGKYLEPSDLLASPPLPQSFYGIIDRNSGVAATDIVTRAQLTQQTIDQEVSFDPPDPDGAGPLGDPSPISARVTSNNAVGTNGWYMDLLKPGTPPVYENEKQVTNPIVRNGHVIFTTVIPETNPCSGGGRSWVMELNVLNGARLDEAPFDLNNDGKFDNADMIPVIDGNGDTIYIPPSGLASEDGMGVLQSPGVVDGDRAAGPVQYKYSPGSSGSIQRITENPGAGTTGRQSWRQIR